MKDVQSGRIDSYRRDFLRKTGAIGIMSTFGIGFFTGCAEDTDPTGRNPTTTPPTSGTNGITVANNVVTVDLAVATALAEAGGWTLIPQARVLLVNTGSNNINALTSVCTHSGCDRNWTFSNNRFTCTCHNSRFNTDGSLVNGPAASPLRTYTVTRNGNIVTVNLSS